ncbi:GAF domain-containing protein [Geitlerinema sp. PCC 7407]|uniref:GAF domain-containing protein n=1 Tax=Geitlerinema sp. PCC 7407 TaxID=1173025 RepID=UPI00029FBB64|nr:GAF domain-containing protein [Geitlerinema sp. PCC 7407]AFY65971.1 multi-sensor signal transduction histidine kinase [Geitlerinema sp. PCC 7407]
MTPEVLQHLLDACQDSEFVEALLRLLRDGQSDEGLGEVFLTLGPVVERLRQAIAITDARRHVVAWNRAAEELLQWPMMEVLGRPLDRFFQAYAAHRDGERLLTWLAKGTGWCQGWILRRQDGTPVPVQMMHLGFHDFAGDLTGFLTVLVPTQELPEASHLAAVLHRREVPTPADVMSYLDRPAVHFKDAFMALDQAFRVRFVSAGAEQVLGRSRSDLLDQNLRSALVGHLTPETLAALQRSMVEEVAIEIEEFCRLRQRWLSIYMYPVAGGLELYLHDITEQRRVRHALEASEYQFWRLVETMNEGFAICDATNQLLYENEKLREMLGGDRSSLIGRSLRDYLAPESLAVFDAHLEQVRRGARSAVELAWSNDSLGQVYTILSTVPAADFGENQRHSFHILTDITQRKRAEQALHQQVEREKLMGAVIQRIRRSLDLNTILSTTVSEVRQLLAMDRVLICCLEEDGSGSVLVESVGPDWRPMLNTQLAQGWLRPATWKSFQQGSVQAIADASAVALSWGQSAGQDDFQIQASLTAPILVGDRRLWGLLMTHQCSSTRQWDPLEMDLLRHLASQVGIAIQQSMFYQEVQTLKADLEVQVQRRTAQLQQSLDHEATLKRLTDRVRDSLDEHQIVQVAVQEVALVLKANCCNAAMYDLEKGISTICYEYAASIPGSQGRVTRLANFPEIYAQLCDGLYFQFCSITPNPVRGRVAMLACPMFDDQGVLGDLWLVNHQDYMFSELEIRFVQQIANQCAIALRQARLYQASQAQVQELEKLNRLKDDFLSTVSHELRTPISNMKMAIHMLKLAPSEAKREQYLDILQAECHRESDLINDLLDLQRLEAEVYPSTCQSVDLETWLPTLVHPFESRIHGHRQRLKVALTRPLPVVTCDRNSLERVIAELLNNACKYTPAGGEIHFCGRRSRRASPPGTALLILSVKNQAEIPPADLNRVFEKFYRVPNGDPWKQGGTGLGLALVKCLVKQLNGTIRASSGGGWTTFTLQLVLTLFPES